MLSKLLNPLQQSLFRFIFHIEHIKENILIWIIYCIETLANKSINLDQMNQKLKDFILLT